MLTYRVQATSSSTTLSAACGVSLQRQRKTNQSCHRRCTLSPDSLPPKPVLMHCSSSETCARFGERHAHALRASARCQHDHVCAACGCAHVEELELLIPDRFEGGRDGPRLLLLVLAQLECTAPHQAQRISEGLQLQGTHATNRCVQVMLLEIFRWLRTRKDRWWCRP